MPSRKTSPTASSTCLSEDCDQANFRHWHLIPPESRYPISHSRPPETGEPAERRVLSFWLSPEGPSQIRARDREEAARSGYRACRPPGLARVLSTRGSSRSRSKVMRVSCGLLPANFRFAGPLSARSVKERRRGGGFPGRSGAVPGHRLGASQAQAALAAGAAGGAACAAQDLLEIRVRADLGAQRFHAQVALVTAFRAGHRDRGCSYVGQSGHGRDHTPSPRGNHAPGC